MKFKFIVVSGPVIGDAAMDRTLGGAWKSWVHLLEIGRSHKPAVISWLSKPRSDPDKWGMFQSCFRCFDNLRRQIACMSLSWGRRTNGSEIRGKDLFVGTGDTLQSTSVSRPCRLHSTRSDPCS